MDCCEVRPLLETFLDGELDTEQTAQVEAHLESCVACAENGCFDQALKNSTRRVIAAERDICPLFMSQLETALQEERRRLESPPTVRQIPAVGAVDPSHRGSLSWHVVLPVVSMAAAFLVWFQMQNQPVAPEMENRRSAERTRQGHSKGRTQTAPVRARVSTAIGLEQVLDNFIDHHASPPAPLVTKTELLHDFESDVGVRVHAPILTRFGANWESASLVAVRNQAAAYMRYRMPGHKITVYVYNPGRVPVRRSLQRRLVHNIPVYVGSWRGYTVAAREERGIGYAAASDLDADAIAELVTEIR